MDVASSKWIVHFINKNTVDIARRSICGDWAYSKTAIKAKVELSLRREAGSGG